MVNIVVWSERNVEIETMHYSILDQHDMIRFLSDLIDKIKYSGEKVCVERAQIDNDRGVSLYSMIKQW